MDKPWFAHQLVTCGLWSSCVLLQMKWRRTPVSRKVWQPEFSLLLRVDGLSYKIGLHLPPELPTCSPKWWQHFALPLTPSARSLPLLTNTPALGLFCGRRFAVRGGFNSYPLCRGLLGFCTFPPMKHLFPWLARVCECCSFSCHYIPCVLYTVWIQALHQIQDLPIMFT